MRKALFDELRTSIRRVESATFDGSETEAVDLGRGRSPVAIRLVGDPGGATGFLRLNGAVDDDTDTAPILGPIIVDATGFYGAGPFEPEPWEAEFGGTETAGSVIPLSCEMVNSVRWLSLAFVDAAGDPDTSLDGVEVEVISKAV